VTAIAIFVAIRVYNALVISSSEPDLADKQAEQEASMNFEVDDSLSLTEEESLQIERNADSNPADICVHGWPSATKANSCDV